MTGQRRLAHRPPATALDLRDRLLTSRRRLHEEHHLGPHPRFLVPALAGFLLRTARPVIFVDSQRGHLERAGVAAGEVWDLLEGAVYRVLGGIDGEFTPCHPSRDGVDNHVVLSAQSNLPEHVAIDALVEGPELASAR